MFERWNLGGNLMVDAYVREDGSCVVWYPDGHPESETGDPTIAVFEDSDEEWTRPLILEPASTRSDGSAIVDKYYQ